MQRKLDQAEADLISTKAKLVDVSGVARGALLLGEPVGQLRSALRTGQGSGRAGIPVAPPFASPQSMGIVYRAWDLARQRTLTDREYSSLLAKRPYDLRHAAVSLWLNAGVPATQVAEWAGYSVNVLLRVYASCIVGQDEASRGRVEAALRSSRRGSST